MGTAWALQVPSKSEPCQDLPLPPALPHHCSAVWGGTSQIRRNNGLGRGQVPLGAQQRAGDAATDSKTVSTLLMMVVLAPDSVSPGLVRSPQSRALLSCLNFPYVPGILISFSLGSLPYRSRGSCRATLSSSSCSCQGPAGQGRAAPSVRPTLPTWDPQSWRACPLCWRSHDL